MGRVGLNAGLGGTIFGFHLSFSVAAVIDSDGVSGLILSPEVGFGTNGFGGFARTLYAPGENSYDTLTGFGTSTTVSAGRPNVSVTLPYRQETKCDSEGELTAIGSYPPVIELGVGSRSLQATQTIAYGIPVGRNRFIGDSIDKIKDMFRFGEEGETDE